MHPRATDVSSPITQVDDFDVIGLHFRHQGARLGHPRYIKTLLDMSPLTSSENPGVDLLSLSDKERLGTVWAPIPLTIIIMAPSACHTNNISRVQGGQAPSVAMETSMTPSSAMCHWCPKISW